MNAMATNVLSKYDNPVVSKKMLEEASRSYDWIISLVDTFSTQGQNELDYLKREVAEAKSEGRLIENNNEVVDLITTIETCCLPTLNKYLPRIQYIHEIALPFYGVCQVVLERLGMKNRCGVKQPYRITAKEIYSLLCTINNQDAHLLIRTIVCPIKILDELLRSYDDKREDSFISLIENNDCDCTDIFKYANTKEAILASRFADSHLMEVSPLDTQALGNTIIQLIEIQDNVEPVFEKINNSLQNIMNGPRTTDSLKILWGLIDEFLGAADTQLDKSIYWSCFSERSCFSNVEKAVIGAILSRPAGIDIYNRYKAEYEAKQALWNREVKTADVNDVEESSGDQTIEVQVETQVGLTLDYSNSEFITFEEFRSMKISENEDEFYIDSKTYTVNEPEYRKSFDNTTLLYEFLCNNKMITHSPDNYYSFLFRMTGRYCSRCEAKSIVFLKEDSSELTYFLGRAIYKRRDSTGTDYSLCDPEKPKRPRYKNGIWQQTYFGDDKRARFFETQEWKDHKPEDPNVIKRISEAATLRPNPKKKIYQDCNNLCLDLFGELI